MSTTLAAVASPPPPEHSLNAEPPYTRVSVQSSATSAAAPLGRRVVAEFTGTLLLVAIVVGSGIAAQRMSPTDVGLQLFENAAATAAGLIAVILAVGPVSGAHLNPVVTLAFLARGGIAAKDAGAYAVAQFAGGVAGSVIANLMFSEPAVEWSTKARTGGGVLLAEVVATAALLLVIFGALRANPSAVPFAVGAYIGAAYFFTSSTSFANPAVTLGRAFTDTFAGIKPSSAPAFIGMQIVGGAIGIALVHYLHPREES